MPSTAHLSLVVSGLALTVAVGGGTAYAAGLVGTAQIKDGAVTSAKIRDHTVSPVDLAASTTSGLQTKALIRTVSGAQSLTTTGHTNTTVLAAPSIPAGQYVAIYRGDVVSFETSDVAHAYYRCSLQAPDGTQVAAGTTFAQDGSSPTIVNQMTVAGTVSLASASKITVKCSHDNTTAGNPYIENQKLILVKVGSINSGTANP